MSMTEIPIAATADAMDRVTSALGAARLVALDTEFVREKTYYPQLCLIQIATGDLIACVDCLAECDRNAFLAALMSDDRIWVLHSARQDLEVVFNLTGRLPATLIDTQIAGALLGMAPQTSLQKLLETTLGVTIEKDQTRADWSARPLPAAALAYALNDVRYLLEAWDALRARLVEAGRLDWLEEECRRLLEADPAATAAAVLERTRGIGSLSIPQLKAAFALVQWREQRASTSDRPRRWIMADDVLVRLARARPQDAAALRSIEGLPARLAEKSGKALIATIAESEALALPDGLAAATDQRRPDKSRLKALQTAVRQKAESLGIAAELLATRRDIAAIEAGNPPTWLREGWRADLLADLL